MSTSSKKEKIVFPTVSAKLHRKLDEILVRSDGSLLFWLFIFSVTSFVIATLISEVIFDKNPLQWQDIVALFFEPNGFNEFQGTGHQLFALFTGLIGWFLFSTLLVSVFVNLFNNISKSVTMGLRRYKLKNHILILGSGSQLKTVLTEIKKSYKNALPPIVVMSPNKVCVDTPIIYYEGCRYQKKDLETATASKAKQIYIIGEDNEENFDSRNVDCLEILKELCNDAPEKILCRLVVKDFATTEIIMHSPRESMCTDKLMVDVINEYECKAEKLMVDTDLLPIIREQDDCRSHVIVFGQGPMAQAAAYTAACLSHYPNFARAHKKTCITFICDNNRQWMDHLISSRPELFKLTNYEYISANGNESHQPEGEFGDFLDVEWKFVDAHETSAIARDFLKNAVSSDEEQVTCIVCHSDAERAFNTAIHLPSMVYAKAKIAVYSNDAIDSLVSKANASGMYGNIRAFGGARDLMNYSQSSRIKRAQRVNYVYCGKPADKTPESIWYSSSSSEWSKFSSIYNTNAIPLWEKCVDIISDRAVVYEMEHRRWVTAVLIIGFVYGKTRDKARFIHPDIIPFDDLSEGEKIKDQLVDESHYIMTGETDK